jgi:hypothetical protein
MNKTAVATLLGGAVVSAGMILAPMASATPGVSFSGPIGNPVGVGGAHATSSNGGVALAVNTGINPKVPQSGAFANGPLSTAVAVDGGAISSGTFTHTFAAEGATIAAGNFDNAVTVFGTTTLIGDGNQVFNAGRNAVGIGSRGVSLNVCGLKLSANADHINTSLPGGAC